MPAAFQIKCNRTCRASELRRHFWLCRHAVISHSKSWTLKKSYFQTLLLHRVSRQYVLRTVY